MRHKSVKRQRGAELIEFVFVLPVILGVFFLILDLGVLTINQSVVAAASREAAREVIQARTNSHAGRFADAKEGVMRVASSLIEMSGRDNLEDEASIADCGAAIPDGGLRVCVTLEDPPPGDDDSRQFVTVTVAYDYRFLLLPKFLGSASRQELIAVTRMRMLTQQRGSS